MFSRTPQTSLEDILRSAEAIDGFIAGLAYKEYASSLMIRSAVERQLQILTEAAVRLRGTAEKLCPAVDWRAIRSLGNFLRHEYDHVSDQEIWLSIHQELPPLVEAVRSVLQNLPEPAPETEP